MGMWTKRAIILIYSEKHYGTQSLSRESQHSQAVPLSAHNTLLETKQFQCASDYQTGLFLKEKICLPTPN